VILLVIQFETWRVKIISGYYMWMAPTWLIWYLLALRFRDTAEAVPTPAMAHS
jgi:hypothetical protein